MSHPADAAISNQYDHIIVGGGSAGCIIAARLSEGGTRRVLLIEAGGTDVGRPSIVEPGSWPANLGSDVDWQYRTTPQLSANGRIFDYARGKVIGGSSTINAMAWVWGHPTDFNAWEDDGNEGWGFASLDPVFKRIETSTRTNSDGSRGDSGPMLVGPMAEPATIVADFLEACREAGYSVKEDVGGPVTEGAGTMDLNMKDGRRFSVVHAYLDPALSRRNLTVLPHTLVESLTFEGTRCVGARCQIAGQRCELRSEHDVVLSAGTIDSPRLLMNSGIGNSDHLRRLGIEVVADLPGVGENLHDHPLIVAFSAETHRDSTRGARTESHLFMRSSHSLPAPDVQILLSPTATGLTDVRPSKGFSLIPALLRPRSRGRLAITAADIRSPLHIDPNFLSDASDLDALCVAVQTCTELGLSTALSHWRVGAVRVAPSGKAELCEFIKRNVVTYNHAVGTCAMGVGNRAVVDPLLRVHGTSNLRIADASVMPSITTGNTLAPTLVIAERAASIIAASAR
jgi:choline dehydrogenase